MLKLLKSFLKSLVVVLSVAAVSLPGALYAQSTTNSIQEQFMGSGGSVGSESPNYTGRDAVGDTGVGDSDSTNYQIDSGYVTDGEPRLIFIVDSSSVGFGDLSTTTASTGNATFSVLNYTSFGYIVQAYGQPPSSGSHVLDEMSSTDASQTGTEQFGMNLRANTSPVTFGSDPVQVPDASFSSGGAAGGYSTVNNFRYVPGETVASAAQSSGRTDYTVSYIVNISNATPGGTYTGQQGFICIGTY